MVRHGFWTEMAGNVLCERKTKIKNNSKVCGLGNWKDGLTTNEDKEDVCSTDFAG